MSMWSTGVGDYGMTSMEADRKPFESERRNLAAMTQEVLEWCRSKGWYDKPVSFGEAMALLHSEVSEAVEAWRQWGTADATGNVVQNHLALDAAKPEGVGSEFADILIRLLDDCGRFSVNLESEVGQHAGLYAVGTSFLENMNALHDHIARASMVYDMADPQEPYGAAIAAVYVFLRECCDEYGVDLQAEYDRKMAYNRTRPYRHGKRQ